MPSGVLRRSAKTRAGENDRSTSATVRPSRRPERRRRGPRHPDRRRTPTSPPPTPISASSFRHSAARSDAHQPGPHGGEGEDLREQADQVGDGEGHREAGGRGPGSRPGQQAGGRWRRRRCRSPPRRSIRPRADRRRRRRRTRRASRAPGRWRAPSRRAGGRVRPGAGRSVPVPGRTAARSGSRSRRGRGRRTPTGARRAPRSRAARRRRRRCSTATTALSLMRAEAQLGQRVAEGQREEEGDFRVGAEGLNQPVHMPPRSGFLSTWSATEALHDSLLSWRGHGVAKAILSEIASSLVRRHLCRASLAQFYPEIAHAPGEPRSSLTCQRSRGRCRAHPSLVRAERQAGPSDGAAILCGKSCQPLTGMVVTSSDTALALLLLFPLPEVDLIPE